MQRVRLTPILLTGVLFAAVATPVAAYPTQLSAVDTWDQTGPTSLLGVSSGTPEPPRVYPPGANLGGVLPTVRRGAPIITTTVDTGRNPALDAVLTSADPGELGPLAVYTQYIREFGANRGPTQNDLDSRPGTTGRASSAGGTAYYQAFLIDTATLTTTHGGFDVYSERLKAGDSETNPFDGEVELPFRYSVAAAVAGGVSVMLLGSALLSFLSRRRRRED